MAEISSLEGFKLATLNEMKLPDSRAANTVQELSCSVNPDSWVDLHGDCLYRYALLRVRHPEVAEDLVQETLFSAVRTYANFRGTSSERSWLCGILKNKICDYFRRLAHEVSFTDLEFLEDEMSHKFIDHGWNHMLQRGRLAIGMLGKPSGADRRPHSAGRRRWRRNGGLPFCSRAAARNRPPSPASGIYAGRTGVRHLL